MNGVVVGGQVGYLDTEEANEIGSETDITGFVEPDVVRLTNALALVAALQALPGHMPDGSVTDAQVTAEDGAQPLRSADDWWIIALGSDSTGRSTKWGPGGGAAEGYQRPMVGRKQDRQSQHERYLRHW